MTNPSKELILHERASEPCYVFYSFANTVEWGSNFTRKSCYYLMSFWIHYCLNETLYTRSDGLELDWNVLLPVKGLDGFSTIFITQRSSIICLFKQTINNKSTPYTSSNLQKICPFCVWNRFDFFYLLYHTYIFLTIINMRCSFVWLTVVQKLTEPIFINFEQRYSPGVT